MLGGKSSTDVKIKIGMRVDEEKGFEEIGYYSKYYGNSKEEGPSSWRVTKCFMDKCPRLPIIF